MPRTSMDAPPARGRRTRNTLATIREAPECSCTPDWAIGPEPCKCSATAVRQGESSDDERAAIIERAVVRWEELARRRRERPIDREVCGRVTLRVSADPQAKSMRAVCRIREGVLTIGIEQRTAAGDTTEKVVAEAPVEALAMCLRQGRFDVFTLATVDKDELFDEIYCFCGDSATRFEWIREFLRLGIPIHDYRN